MQDSSTSFGFKFGTVHVNEERLTLEQDNARGKMSNALVGRSPGRLWFLYVGLIGWMLWKGWISAQAGDVTPLILAVVLAGWLAYQYRKNQDFTLVREMSREQVTRIEQVRGIRFVTLNRLVVHLTIDGEALRRTITMPTTTQGGNLEATAACLREAGWPVDAANRIS